MLIRSLSLRKAISLNLESTMSSLLKKAYIMQCGANRLGRNTTPKFKLLCILNTVLLTSTKGTLAIINQNDYRIHFRLWYLGMGDGDICHCGTTSNYSICNIWYLEVKKSKHESKATMDCIYSHRTLSGSCGISILGT